MPVFAKKLKIESDSESNGKIINSEAPSFGVSKVTRSIPVGGLPKRRRLVRGCASVRKPKIESDRKTPNFEILKATGPVPVRSDPRVKTEMEKQVIYISD